MSDITPVLFILGIAIGLPVLVFLGPILDVFSWWIMSVREGVSSVWRALIYGRY